MRLSVLFLLLKAAQLGHKLPGREIPSQLDQQQACFKIRLTGQVNRGTSPLAAI
jgi:hypothetical protein